MTTQKNVTAAFKDLPLAAEIQKTLAHLQLVNATPIQTACIAPAVEGKDIIGIAQTGTGKTFAFGLPLIQRIKGTSEQGLIVVPTRELALQVEESLRKVASGLGLKFAVLIGGASMGQQKNALRARPNVIIATPGRLIDHLKQKTVSLRQTSILVLDEADRMFDMGFAPQVEQILHELPSERQTMLFSATMPDGISQMVKRYMKLPVRIEIAPQGSVAEKLVQEMYVIRGGMKSQLLEKLLSEYDGTVLVFVRTKYAATRISNLIRAMGHSSAELHSNRTLGQRKQALQGFKGGRYRVLVATDIAARGIDVTNIELVINYDLPENPEDYVHRIGRTGRAGLTGKAISFAAPDQMSLLKRIERLTRTRLPQSPLPKELPESRVPPRTEFDHGNESRGQRFKRDDRPRTRSVQRSFTPSQQIWTKDSIKEENAIPKEGDIYSFGRDDKVMAEEESRPRRGGGFYGRRTEGAANPRFERGRNGGFNRSRSAGTDNRSGQGSRSEFGRGRPFGDRPRGTNEQSRPERRSFDGKRSFGNRSRGSSEQFGGTERKDFGSRRSFGERENRTPDRFERNTRTEFGNKKSFGNRDRRSADSSRSSHSFGRTNKPRRGVGRNREDSKF